MKKKIIASVILISLLSIPMFWLITGSGTMKTQNTATDSGVYVGTLREGQSYMIFGEKEPIVELTFYDNRTFTAPEQMAAEAQMKINGTYQITFSSTAPGVATAIKGVD